MAGAFRDELEAARSRAEALREENEELREELDRLRAQPAAESRPEANRGPDSLTRRTLERLQQLIEEIDAAPAPREGPEAIAEEDLLRPSPPRAQPTADAHEATSAATELMALRRRDAIAQRDLKKAAAERRELEELRRWRSRARGWIALAFAVGVMVGALIATVLR